MLEKLAAADLNNAVFPPALFGVVALAFITAGFAAPFSGKTRVCLALIGVVAAVICFRLITKS
ncbi:MAG TPA: hypothetical protein VJ843_03555 [Candidatus Saccharimonadales bacterium]|nr:hypothetical protein [Candidatus Saccharimonadales bacterium]